MPDTKRNVHKSPQASSTEDNSFLPTVLQTTVQNYVGRPERKTVEPRYQDTRITYKSDTHHHNSLSLFTEHLGCAHLLEYVIRGEEKEAQAILQKYPALAVKTVHDTVSDYSGREITDVSPFIAAVCAGDIDMLKMIKDCLAQSSNKDELSELMMNQLYALYQEQGVNATIIDHCKKIRTLRRC